MVNVAENVSETFLMWFTMMFWVSVVSLVGVMLGCIGMAVSCCACLGGFLHWVGNCAYFILIIVGSVYRWSATGKLCSGDAIFYGKGEETVLIVNKAPHVKANSGW